MPLYDLTAPHPLLSGKAKAMLEADDEQFKSQVEVAETYMGLIAVPLYTGAKAKQVKNFLAQQVNWQIEIALDPLYIKTTGSSHMGNVKTYRDNIILHPGVALGLQTVMKTWGYRTVVRTLR